LTIFLLGCSKAIILYPLEKTHIICVPKGAKVDENETVHDGCWVSNEYIEKVLKARVK
jgi:hypothetical protein